MDQDTNLPLSIDHYSADALEGLVAEAGQPRFRADQLFAWLYHHGIQSYDEASNLPAALRTWLNDHAPLRMPSIVDTRVSADGTRKYLFQLNDGNLVEAVGIPAGAGEEGHDRLTVCFSTQVGCAMECTFCATGQEGFTRNLTPGEMAFQVLAVGKDFGERVSNAVAMGQGEPFLNYDNVMAALRILNHPKALGIGARHITVSTCGITQGIERFGEEGEQFVLAVSLHSAMDETRHALMPRAAATPLPVLKASLLAYQEKAKRRVTFEYLLAAGVNDSDSELAALVAFCKGLSVHVNLLPVNAVEGSPLAPSPASTVRHWITELGGAGIESSLRTSRGSDIKGACGQLKNDR